MLNKLQEIFNAVTGRTDIVISENMKLNSKEVKLSSFTLIQLVCAIEDEFDIEIPNSQIKKFKTVRNIIDYLKEVAN